MLRNWTDQKLSNFESCRGIKELAVCIVHTTWPYLTLCASPLLWDYCDILIQASLFRLTAVCQVAMSAHCSCPSHSPDQIFYKVRHHRACCEHLQRGHVQKYLCQLEQMFMKLESESRFKYVFRKDHGIVSSLAW